MNLRKVLFRFYLAVDAVLARLDYTNLVVYFFAKFAVRDYCFLFGADLY